MFQVIFLRHIESVQGLTLTLIKLTKIFHSFSFDLFGCLTQGSIEEEKLATFNIPFYAPSEQELKQIVDNEGSFKLNHLETFKLPWDANYRDIGDSSNQKTKEEYLGMHLRAIFEPILASHFGVSIMNDLFHKWGQKASAYLKLGKGITNNVIISLVKE